MITAEKDYRGEFMCPICTCRFEISADEDSNYDGAATEFGCPDCGRRLIADARPTYSISIKYE